MITCKIKHLNKAIFHIVFLNFSIILLLILSPYITYGTTHEMYYSMGQKYMDQNKYDLAVLAFKQATEMAPDWPEAHNALGEAYIQLLKFEEALAEFDKALELNPDYIDASINRRRAMMSFERYKPIGASRLKRWQKGAILGGITISIAVVFALIIYSRN
ncbi:tetratricopeptide repeat protein [Candidatus Poribacteria bacterium]|nr:tetratricopeptide repeat protein [Candidatus Poribacteria bacterium]